MSSCLQDQDAASSAAQTAGRQRGQAMVLVLVFLTVLMLSLLILFNIAQVSRKKIEVQNAADAVAYSAAVLEARHLNFTAFTNRAMIANEVGIAQTIGLTSWLLKWGKTFPNLGWWLNKMITPIPIVGPPLAQAIKAAFDAIGKAIDSVAKGIAAFADGYARLVAMLDPFYGYSQLGFRFATYDSIVAAGMELPDENAPGSRMATMAELYGLYHLYMFNKYNVGYKPVDAYGKNLSSKKKKVYKEGMRRFAAAVNSSRDGWSKDRHNDELLFDREDIWVLDLGIFGSYKFGYKAVFGFQGEGASSLRFLAGSGATKSKEYYNWSSMDTEEFKFALGIWLFDVYAGIPPTPGMVLPIPMGWGTMQMAKKPKGSTSPWKLMDVPKGGYKKGTAGWKSTYGRTWWDSTAGDLDERGNSVSSFIASTAKNLPYSGDTTTIVKESYGGLPPYHDINPEMDAPPDFVVWIHQPKGNIATSDNRSDGSAATGKLDMENEMIEPFLDGTEGVNALAAGQVYYSRTDGLDESPNTFSPYWQARLAPIDQNTLFAVMTTHDPMLAWAFTGIEQSANVMKIKIQDEVNEIKDEVSEGLDIVIDVFEDIF